MRTIDTPGSFKRDFKRESKGQHRATFNTDLKSVIDALVLDRPLAASYRDHSLTGEWDGCRECHIKPDLLLIYKKVGRAEDVAQASTYTENSRCINQRHLAGAGQAFDSKN